MEEERYYYVEKIEKIDKNLKGLRESSKMELLVGGTLLMGGLILQDNNLLLASYFSLAPVIPNVVASHVLTGRRKANFEEMIGTWSDYPELLYRIESGNFDTKKVALTNLLEKEYSYEEISRRTRIPVEELYDIMDVPSADRLEELETKFARKEDCLSTLEPEEVEKLSKLEAKISELDDQIHSITYLKEYYTRAEESKIKMLTAKRNALEEQYNELRNLGLKLYVDGEVSKYKKSTLRLVL